MSEINHTENFATKSATVNSTSLNYIKRLGTPIAALASGLGGPVAIVRVSGKDLSFLKQSIGSFPKAGEHALRKFRSSTLENDFLLDEVLVLYFKAPHSFTGEDVIEIQGHGVPALVDSMLAELQRLGCEMAMAGEFSFRAVWNDKMSLEAASRLQMLFATEGLGASSASRLLSFTKSHDSKIQALLSDCIQSTLKARGRVEAAIDFAEAEEEQAEDIAGASERVADIRHTLTQLINTFEVFTQNASIPQVVVAGLPNAGKSTLLNVLCGSERSIVSALEGTTRDYVEVSLKSLGGRNFKLIDTAGLRNLSEHSMDAHHSVESLGIKKGLELLGGAQILLWVWDARSQTHLEQLNFIKKSHPSLRVIEIGSHRDLVNLADKNSDVAESRVESLFSFVHDQKKLREFVLTQVDLLEAERELLLNDLNDEALISQRQRALLSEVVVELDQTQLCLNGMRPLELVGDHLREVEFKLRQVLGQDLGEDYIGEIFSQFCLGK